MSHWAEIDEQNVVIRVLTGDNNDPNGDEGYQWLIENLGGRWIQTSYNSNFRHKFAGMGDTWDEGRDIFIPKKPFNAWIFDFDELRWKPPTAAPVLEDDDSSFYIWSEENNDWILVIIQN